MSALVIRGDARRLPLADASVDLIVTSPPYFGLRSYQDGGEHYAGQVGDEATPAEFLAALWACTREWMRVLKPDGNLWVNLGDKYAGKGGGVQGATSQRVGRANVVEQIKPGHIGGARDKSLIGIPWRYALGCIDDLGLILRAEVIWSKPNGLPESVTDRVRRSHEHWFHFVKQPRYFSAVDEVREQVLHPDWSRPGRCAAPSKEVRNLGQTSALRNADYTPNPLGKLPGSVWTVATEPLNVPAHLGIDHFAAFPTEWPRRIIQGWSPAGVCTACGHGRRPVSDKVRRVRRTGAGRQSVPSGPGAVGKNAASSAQAGAWSSDGYSDVTITGYACACDPKVCRTCNLPSVPFCDGYSCCDSCTHDAPPATTPSIVLDPFGGTGTTALVAHALGRVGISVDLSHDYSRLARWRTTDRGELAKAMRVEKPPKPMTGQIDMFGEEAS